MFSIPILYQLDSPGKDFAEWCETELGRMIVKRLREHWLLRSRIAAFETPEDAIQRAMILLWEEWRSGKLVESAIQYKAQTADQVMRLVTRHILLRSATIYSQRRVKGCKFDSTLSLTYDETNEDRWLDAVKRPVEEAVMRKFASDEPTEAELLLEDVKAAIEHTVQEMVERYQSKRAGAVDVERLSRVMIEAYMFHHVPGQGNRGQNSFGEFVRSHGFNNGNTASYGPKLKMVLAKYLGVYNLTFGIPAHQSAAD